MADRKPCVTLILADPQRAGGSADCEPFTTVLDGQGMPVDQVVCMALGQAGVEDIEVLAGVAGAGDHQPSIDGNALFILLRGDEPGGIRIGRVDRGGEAKTGGRYILQLPPAPACVVAEEDAVVVLHPEAVRMGGTVHDAVGILGQRIRRLLGRHIGVAQAFADQLPVLSTISRGPDTAYRYTDGDMGRANTMDTGSPKNQPRSISQRRSPARRMRNSPLWVPTSKRSAMT